MGQREVLSLRAIAILLILATVGAVVPTTQAATVTYEARGTFTTGNGVNVIPVYEDSCSISGQLNDLYSSCRSLQGKNVDGLFAMARAEGTTAPLVKGMGVCFYAAYNYMLDCPPSEGCPDGTWTWCAHVPNGSRLFGISSATGVNVAWHIVIG